MVEKASHTPKINIVIAEDNMPSHSGVPDTGILDPEKMPITFERKQPLVDRAVGALVQALDDLLDKSLIGK